MDKPIIEINISEDDVRASADHRLVQELSGKEKPATLGAAEDAKERLMSVLPTIIAKKVQEMIPKDFEIMEIALAMKVKGNFGLAGIDGDVNIKFRPAKPK